MLDKWINRIGILIKAIQALTAALKDTTRPTWKVFAVDLGLALALACLIVGVGVDAGWIHQVPLTV